ncbi:MAG: dienelactone hydrolase family protein [Chloroflexi bacterium]|nr:dienelactone hydrolase family protein [Chloroflexota bacterium]
MAEREVVFGEGLHGVLHQGGTRAAVLLSHGSGRGMDTPLLETVARRWVEDGFTVLRWNFGYLGKRPAPSSGGKRETDEMRTAIEYLKGQSSAPLVLAGKSFGARVSTYVAAGRNDVAALVYFGLPLHGMGKNAKPRDWSHLREIGAPMLFITGERDQLCSLEHLREVQQLVRSPYTSEVVPGDHSFKPRGEAQAIDIAVRWLGEQFPAT